MPLSRRAGTAANACTRCRTLRQLATELVAELRRLDRRITDATTALADAVTASGST